MPQQVQPEPYSLADVDDEYNQLRSELETAVDLIGSGEYSAWAEKIRASLAGLPVEFRVKPDGLDTGQGVTLSLAYVDYVGSTTSVETSVGTGQPTPYDVGTLVRKALDRLGRSENFHTTPELTHIAAHLDTDPHSTLLFRLHFLGFVEEFELSPNREGVDPVLTLAPGTDRSVGTTLTEPTDSHYVRWLSRRVVPDALQLCTRPDPFLWYWDNDKLATLGGGRGGQRIVN